MILFFEAKNRRVTINYRNNYIRGTSIHSFNSLAFLTYVRQPVASYRTKSRTRVRHVLPFTPFSTCILRETLPRKRRKKKSHLLSNIYIYIYINHHLPRINNFHVALFFAFLPNGRSERSSWRRKREKGGNSGSWVARG